MKARKLAGFMAGTARRGAGRTMECVKAAAGAVAVVCLALAPALPSRADDAHHIPKTAQSAASTTAGMVKKVDKSAGKITIQHEAIDNLAMPKMTMVFRVTDAAFLDRVKPGDKIRFAAEKINGAYTVTQIDSGS